MKIIIAMLMMVSVCALAQVPAVVSTGSNQRAPIRKPVYHNHPLTPLLYEDFENASGYDTYGWGNNVISPGTVNPDNSTNVLYGTQSLAIDESHDDPTCVTNAFFASGHVWMAFRLKIMKTPAAGPYNTFMRLNDAGGSCQMRMTLDSDLEMAIQPGCGSGIILGTPLSVGVIYNVWIEYFKDNGANRYGNIAYSTGPARPTDSSTGFFVEGTSTSTATDVSILQIGHDASENGQEVDFIIDHVLIDDVQIGNYP